MTDSAKAQLTDGHIAPSNVTLQAHSGDLTKTALLQYSLMTAILWHSVQNVVRKAMDFVC